MHNAILKITKQEWNILFYNCFLKASNENILKKLFPIMPYANK